jgi:hypothetical protein
MNEENVYLTFLTQKSYRLVKKLDKEWNNEQSFAREETKWITEKIQHYEKHFDPLIKGVAKLILIGTNVLYEGDSVYLELQFENSVDINDDRVFTTVYKNPYVTINRRYSPGLTAQPHETPLIAVDEPIFMNFETFSKLVMPILLKEKEEQQRQALSRKLRGVEESNTTQQRRRTRIQRKKKPKTNELPQRSMIALKK